MAQDYIKYVESMRGRYPNLRRFCDILGANPAKNMPQQSRVAVIEIQEKGVNQRDFGSADDLDQYMQGQSSDFRACKHRLYVLEGLEPSYVEILACRLRTGPFVFAEQLLRGGTRKEQAAMLPTQHGLETSVTMHYVESLVFPEAQLNNLGACCLYLDRKIWATKVNSRFDEVAQVHRIASFWSRQEADGFFNALIISDPPVGDSMKIGKSGRKEVRPCRTELYQGGYIDISPFPRNPEFDTLGQPAPCPSRESLFDDILFYWSHADRFPNLRSHLLKDAPASAEGTAFFLNRIIASNWMQFLVYFDEIIDRLEYALARADIKALDGVENHLSDVEFWQRRCRKSREHVEQTVDALRKVYPCSSSQTAPLEDSICKCMDDFVYIHNQICALQERCQRLTQSLTYVISIIQSKQSSEEAHSLKIITVLGMLFVPLTLMSSIFSMSDKFQPGAKYFWVYFVTSLPIVAMVFSIVFAKQVAEALRIKKRDRRALLNVRLSARLANHEQETVDIEKGKC